MKNLTPILEREGRFYKIGPITFPRGVQKRTFLAFAGAFGIMYFLSKVPPFLWTSRIDNIGWAINYLLIPAIVATLYSSAKIHGKKPERYILTMIRYRLMPKHVTPYRTLKGTQTYKFGTGFTACERKEEGETDAVEVSDSAYRGKPRLQHG